ncbi:MAG: sugar kinase [Sphingomonadales bacterium]|nr:sugar kinase [Sphingomonadales bacterium]
MLELARHGERWDMGYGGDTLNTAIHLARAGNDVAYLTALGRDPLSRHLHDSWAAEGIDTSLICEHPTRQPGLYAIATDANGERSFAYWRDSSAARELFTLADAGLWRRATDGVALFCFSLISLAILPESGRRSLFMLANMVKDGGGKVAFDGNYRARLWESADEARTWRDIAIGEADIGLPTLEDEIELGGRDSGPATANEVAARWQALGCGEVVVKLGRDGVRLPDGTVQPPPALITPVDTSGAGDAFNAGYLAARLDGTSIAEAARAGQALAAWTIMRPGAIPPRDS